jgi:hypothetical protein
MRQTTRATAENARAQKIPLPSALTDHAQIAWLTTIAQMTQDAQLSWKLLKN